MARYTDRILECEKCFKKNSFLVQVIQKDNQAYYITQCPKCKSYDEVKKISLDEYESSKPKPLLVSEF